MILKKRFKFIVFGGSALHSLVMVLLTFFVMNSSMQHWDDQEIASAFLFLKKKVLKIEKKLPQTDFLFVDVSLSNELVDVYDENGLLIGNHDITDRKALSQFFHHINTSNSHKYLLCDIQFFEKSPHDSALAVELGKTKNVIVSTHRVDGIYKKPLFSVDYALSDYEGDGDVFKYRFIYGDSIKGTALAMYEAIHKDTATAAGTFFKMNNHFYLNNPVLDFRIRNIHYAGLKKEQESSVDSSVSYNSTKSYRIPMMFLGTFLETAEVIEMSGDTAYFSDEYLKDRIIVVGDFSDRDIHSTIDGDMAGPVILLNAYLALVNGDNHIKWTLILYLFVVYWFISLMIFHPNDFVEAGLKKIFPRSEVLRSIFGFLSYLFFLLLIDFICYLVFDIQFTVIIIILYVKFADWLVKMLVYKRILNKDSKLSQKLVDG